MWPAVAVLVLSQYVEERYATELLAGDTRGVGYLLKDRVADVESFVEALHRVRAGGTALDPEVVSQIFARSRRAAPLATLTRRERDVLALMAEGRSNDGADGDVTASRLSGPLTVDRLTGDITAVDLTGPLDLRSSTGEITGDALRAEVVRAGSDTGDVQLELVVPPQSVDITTSDGEVDLTVPGDTAYRVEAGSDSGEERVLVPIDPASARTLRVDGDTGDVTVRPSR